MGTVSLIRRDLKPCYLCAYSTKSVPMGCIRLTGTPDVLLARKPGSLYGVHGVLWVKQQSAAMRNLMSKSFTPDDRLPDPPGDGGHAA